MNENKVQNQPPPPQPQNNVGMNSLWNNWPGMQYQQRYPYWPQQQQWPMPAYPMNMQMTGGLLPHPGMPYHQGMNMQNFNFTQFQQPGNHPNNNSNNSNVNSNDNTVPGTNNETKNEANDKVENPDKIPLPDGPPPPPPPPPPPDNRLFPPLPPNSPNATNNSSPRMFFKPNNQPLKFNMNQQQNNKGFQPFNLSNKKNKRKNKNKNQQQPHPFASLFSNNKNNANMPMGMNFTPPKPYSTVPPPQALLSTPPGAPSIQPSQENNTSGDSEMKNETNANQNPMQFMNSVSDWPPSLQ